MIRWRFNENNPVREMLEQMLQAAAQQPVHGRGDPMPINVHQSETDLLLEAALPGVEPEEFLTVLTLAFMKVRRTTSSAPDPSAWKKQS